MATKNLTMNVNGMDITVVEHNEEDYICISDMVKGTEGDDHIRNWMRNKNTIEFLGLWEQLNNPKFKGVEFDTFLNEAGLNRFNMTPRKWINATNSIGIISKAGRNGGTYAHKDIAFEFASWISPLFKLYLIKEFQRLKKYENAQENLEWDVKRTLTKVNYHIHTNAIKEYIIPQFNTQNTEWIYADEADMLNIIMFGMTAKQWREKNPEKVFAGKNIRDYASLNQLSVLTNLETHNADFIKKGLSKNERIEKLCEIAQSQMDLLNRIDNKKSQKELSNSTYVDGESKKLNPFDKSLKTTTSYNPKEEKDDFDKGMNKIICFNIDED